MRGRAGRPFPSGGAAHEDRHERERLGETGTVHPVLAPDPELGARLREHALRVTSARLLVMAAIRDLEHPTVEALHHATAPAGIVLTTVYRTLETLERAGLVWAVHVPGTGRTYHLGSEHPHAHLLCRSCGRLDDLDAVPADALTGVPGDFAVEHVQLTVIGLCPACRAQAPGGDAGT